MISTEAEEGVKMWKALDRDARDVVRSPAGQGHGRDNGGVKTGGFLLFRDFEDYGLRAAPFVRHKPAGHVDDGGVLGRHRRDGKD